MVDVQLSLLAFVPLGLALVVNMVWMGLALGAVLNKLGAPTVHAWIPVMRWIAAARVGRTSELAVAVARGMALLGGIAVVGAGVGIATGSGGAQNGLLIVSLVGSLAWLLGTLIGWILWIYGAGTIQMRMRAPRGLSWIAALWPLVWASIMGWGKYRAIGGGAATTENNPRRAAPVTPGLALASAGGAPVQESSSDEGDAPVSVTPTTDRAPAPSPFALTSEPDEPAAPTGSAPPAPSSTPSGSPFATSKPSGDSAPAAPAASATSGPTSGSLSSLPPGWSEQPAAPAPAAQAPAAPTPPPAAPTPPPPSVEASRAPEPAMPYSGQLSPYLAAPQGQQPESAPEPAPSAPEPAPSAPEPAPPVKDQTPTEEPIVDLGGPMLPPLDPIPSVGTPLPAVTPPVVTPPPSTPPSTPPAATPPPASPPPNPPSAPPLGNAHATSASAVPTPLPSDVDDDDDHTVIARRRRDTWAIEAEGHTYEIGDELVVVGRATAKPTAGTLGIADSTRTMSKRHAELFRRDDVWWVRDLNSTNGTFIRAADGTEQRVEGTDGKAVEGELMLGDLPARIIKLEDK